MIRSPPASSSNTTRSQALTMSELIRHLKSINKDLNWARVKMANLENMVKASVDELHKWLVMNDTSLVSTTMLKKKKKKKRKQHPLLKKAMQFLRKVRRQKNAWLEVFAKYSLLVGHDRAAADALLLLPHGPLNLYITMPNPTTTTRPRPVFLFTPEARKVVEEINEFIIGLGSPRPPMVPSQNRLINARDLMPTRYKTV